MCGREAQFGTGGSPYAHVRESYNNLNSVATRKQPKRRIYYYAGLNRVAPDSVISHDYDTVADSSSTTDGRTEEIPYIKDGPAGRKEGRREGHEFNPLRRLPDFGNHDFSPWPLPRIHASLARPILCLRRARRPKIPAMSRKSTLEHDATRGLSKTRLFSRCWIWCVGRLLNFLPRSQRGFLYRGRRPLTNYVPHVRTCAY